jgi:23S rRNA (uracil1939-C5)-methyltransferase
VLLDIEKLIYGGDGLARLPADEAGHRKAVFVPFVLDREQIEATVVEVNRGYDRAKVEQILEPSPDRVEPQCPYFQACGGCQYQHSSYEHQREIKTAILKENLRRIAKIELETELVIHPSPPWNYRNRTRLKFSTEPEFALGYYRFNSHELLPVEECPICSPLINRAIVNLWQAGRANEVPGDVEEIELFTDAEDKHLLIEVYCASSATPEVGRRIGEALRSAVFACIGAVVFRARNRGTGPELIANIGAGEISYETARSQFRVSAGSFFQVNRFLIDELVTIVSAEKSGKLAIDLYAGVGLFSLDLSKSFAQVIAVESSPTAYADLFYNAKPNIKAIHAATDWFLNQGSRKLQPDLVIVDPPRGGLGEVVVRGLGRLGARQVTYVSCDPATLSRDLAGLLNAGYGIQRAHVVDLFPQTFHIESIFELVKVS